MALIYYRITAYKQKKLCLNVIVHSEDSMINCVRAFNDLYSRISVTPFLTGSEDNEDD